MAKITLKSLWIDRDQGTTANDRAFGFVGTHAADEYCGFFFDYLGEKAEVTSESQIEEIVDSLSYDETCDRDGVPHVPHRFAAKALRKELEKMLAKHESYAANYRD